MRSYVTSLTKVNNRKERDYLKMKELDSVAREKYKILQNVAKNSMVLKKNYQRRAINQNRNNMNGSSVLKMSNSNRTRESAFLFDSSEYIYRNFVLPAQKSHGAKRFYDSDKYTNLIREGLEEFADLQKYPNPSLIPLYDATIDPVLHIGSFTDFEIQWKNQ